MMVSVLDSMVLYFLPTGTVDASRATALRLVRLTRLTRLVRVFRLRMMKELTLMVKGLLVGMTTLFWAFVLLLMFIYVFSIVLTTMFITSDEEPPKQLQGEIELLYPTLLMTMYTTFRCFMGDCSTSQGTSLVVLLTRYFGGSFAVIYTIFMIFVVFGLFNLIAAVYVENTLANARHAGESARARKKEALRVARNTKLLLKKLYAAQRAVNDAGCLSRELMNKAMMHCSDDDLRHDVTISKETFFYALQEPSVRALLDDLDITQERARLFDVLDADGDGRLDIKELIRGLLRVRGDSQRSDTVSVLLSMRSFQDSFRLFATEATEWMRTMDDRLSALAVALGDQTPLTGMADSPNMKVALVADSSETASGDRKDTVEF
eukprot:NODE_824_length_1350_cov_419.744402.p1 GENE.NODE_824_length_1350_cov_419.744402~~NODE_824_length_1350_cov_419.744402.p1  ORF type:complete len:407 (+),score=137.10 NODE_824_length_1350_cov_419.744402:88-1221(+)